MIHFIRARRLRVAHPVFSVDLFFVAVETHARSVSWRTDRRGIRGEYRSRDQRLIWINIGGPDIASAAFSRCTFKTLIMASRLCELA